MAMGGDINFPEDGSTSGWLPAELFSNPENHQNHHQIGSLMPENNGFLLTSQPRNQSFPNNIGSNENMDPRSLHLLEAQLQRLRLDNAVRGQQHGNNNNTNQQTLAGPSGIGNTQNIHDSFSERITLMGQRYNDVTTPLRSLRGMMVSMSREEHGSQFLVRCLDEGNLRNIEFIVLEVTNDLHELMMDHYGNRVVQKIFDVAEVNQMTCLVDLIVMDIPKFQTVCNHCIGTRAIQKMIDHITTERQIKHFTRGLKIIIGEYSLAKSQYGGYVIQHFLKHFPVSFSVSILDAMANACTDIAKDKVGCSVIQRCLSNAKLPSSSRLIDALISHALSLSQDLYGNYVVQYVIKLKEPPYNAKIVKKLRESYVHLSMNKYASNVVEDLLRFSTDQNDVAIIVQELINSPSFLYLLQDPYGNYVAQRAFQCSKGALRDALLKKIMQHYANLCGDPFGKRVLAFILGPQKF